MTTSRRVLLVGEAPGKRGRPGDPALGGRIARRLARLSGLTLDEYEAMFDRVNLLPEWPGKASGNGSAWPRAEARAAARVMAADRRLSSYALVIFLGRRVADAFGVRCEVPWFALWGTIPVRAVAPHPSGANRWWNDPENREMAEIFWRMVVDRVGA